MILVKTNLGVSKIEGIGLFANEDIKKGTIVIKNNDNFGIAKYFEEQWKQMEKELSKESFRQIKKYAYKDKQDGLHCLCLDDTRFINHSKNPNIKTIGDNDVAVRDIEKGEEILIDYTVFCANEDLENEKYLK